MEKDYFKLIKEAKDDVEEIREEGDVLSKWDIDDVEDNADEEKSDVAREIYEIAESTLIGLQMEDDYQFPIFSLERDLTESQEIRLLIEVPEDKTAELIGHVDMGELIGLISRNWSELKQLTVAEIRNAMVNFHNWVNPTVMEAAIDTALHVVRAEAV